ncbi:MAG: hypothetical protein LW853_05710 [Rickettsiales bacterium]|nr:hypothetical protein [Rickettsiales bacterium]
MPKTAIHHAMIASWERPEEELRFLKETLKDKDWRAEIIYPANQPAAQLQSQRMQRTLEDQGYLVNSILTDKGETILKIHHLGVDSKLRDIARETSLSGTLTQIARHPLIPLRNTLQSAQNAIDKLDDVVKDPAQANGLIFTVAEAFLTLAGLGNKSGQKESFWTKIKQPRNYLQSLAGGLYLGQSITYLTLAKSNDQRSFEQLKDKVTRTSNQEHSLLELRYQPESDQSKPSPLRKIGDYFRKYPIQIGAVLNDIGMVAYMGHAFFTRRYYLQNPHLDGAANYVKRGFWRDIGGGITSIVAWSLLLLPSRKKEEQDSEQAATEKSVGTKLVDYFKDNPETGTGILTMASSGQRLMGSLAKKNYIQAIGESIYLPGDFLLLFTKNSEYSDHTQHNREKLAAKIANFVDRLPVVMGPRAQHQFILNITHYLRDKTLADQAGKSGEEVIPVEELDMRTTQLAKTIEKNLREKKNNDLDHLAESTAALLFKFPAPLRSQLQSQLTQVLSQMSWIHATPEELHHAIDEVPAPVQSQAIRLPAMRELSQNVGKIATTVRNIDKAATVSALYEVLRHHITPSFQPQPQIISATSVHLGATHQPHQPTPA